MSWDGRLTVPITDATRFCGSVLGRKSDTVVDWAALNPTLRASPRVARLTILAIVDSEQNSDRMWMNSCDHQSCSTLGCDRKKGACVGATRQCGYLFRGNIPKQVQSGASNYPLDCFASQTIFFLCRSTILRFMICFSHIPVSNICAPVGFFS